MADSDGIQLSYHKVLSQDIDNASDSDEIQQSTEATNATASSINHDNEEETKNETEQLLSESHDNSNLAITKNSNQITTGNQSQETTIAGDKVSDESPISQQDINEEMKVENKTLKQQVREYIPIKLAEWKSGQWKDLLHSEDVKSWEEAIQRSIKSWSEQRKEEVTEQDFVDRYDDEKIKIEFGNTRTKREMYIVLIKSQDYIETIEINEVKRELIAHSRFYKSLYLRFLFPSNHPGSPRIHIKLTDNIEFTLSTEEFGEQKEYDLMEDGKLKIYVKKMQLFFQVLEERNVCDAYLSWSGKQPTGDDDYEWKRYYEWLDSLYLFNRKYSYIWEDPEMSEQQIYYDDFYKVLYWINTAEAKHAITFGGNDDSKDIYKLERCYARLFDLQEDIGHIAMDTRYRYQSITEQLWITDRYYFIKNELLYGQDNEFNIFRSLCFLPPEYKDNNLQKRLSIGLLCLIAQFLLTIGIVMEVYNNWDIDEMFDTDWMIIIISFVVFSFISYTTRWTLIKFLEFYKKATHVMKISWYIILLDFISNIVIGFIICLVSFFYLLQSETITDVVLNSFALTFIVELDDIANLFESDEDALMQNDWKQVEYEEHGQGGDYDTEKKRRILKPIPYDTILKSVVRLCLSPLYIIDCAYRVCWDGYKLIEMIRSAIKRDDKFDKLEPSLPSEEED